MVFVAQVGQLAFDWYARNRRSNPVKVGLPVCINEGGEPDPGPKVQEVKDATKLQTLLVPGRKLWLFKNRTYTHDPLELTQHWLDKSVDLCHTARFFGIEIRCYATNCFETQHTYYCPSNRKIVLPQPMQPSH